METRTCYLHVTTRLCSTGPVAIVRLTGGRLDWRTVRVPSLALPSAELDAVARQALRHSFAGHGVLVCAQYWLRLP